MTRIIRSKRHGCFKVAESAAWGRYLVPVEDPEGLELSENDIEGIKLIENFPRVPKEIWAPIINLYFFLCDDKKAKIKNQDTELEVSIVFLRSADDFSKWRAIVPKQVVTGASVEADFSKSCDIVTGEELSEFPPVGWVHAGSSHSHNTMQAFFSYTDDKNELGVPGLHIVVGKIDKQKMRYQHRASIVLQHQRKFVKLNEVVDPTPVALRFHPKVLEYIKVYDPPKKKKKFHLFGPGKGKEKEAPQVVSHSDFINEFDFPDDLEAEGFRRFTGKMGKDEDESFLNELRDLLDEEEKEKA